MNSNHLAQAGMTLLELTVVLLILTALAGLTIPYVGGTGRMAMCQATDATLLAVREAIMGGRAGQGFYGDTLGHYPHIVKGGEAIYLLHFLFQQNDVGTTVTSWPDYNAKTTVGWRGPYLNQGGLLESAVLNGLDGSFGMAYDPVDPGADAYVHASFISYDGADANTAATVDEATGLVHVLDAWHRPIVLQIPYNGSALDLEYARLVSAGPGSGVAPGDASMNTLIADWDGSGRGDDRVLYLKHSDPYAPGNIACDRL